MSRRGQAKVLALQHRSVESVLLLTHANTTHLRDHENYKGRDSSPSFVFG